MEAEALLSSVLGLDSLVIKREKTDRPAVTVPKERLLSFMQKLRDNDEYSFDMLCTHTAIDWIQNNQFELIYQLYSTRHAHYLMVSTLISREAPSSVPTLSSLWRIAEWQEREVYDLFGVLYEGHPDLRRLFLEDDWVGYPLRKDYKDDFMLERPE